MTGFLKANYHTHTYRCQHAYGSEREYIEAAIRMGIAELGFSDHVPCPFKDGYVSGIRMTMEQAPSMCMPSGAWEGVCIRHKALRWL